jgi:DNA-binding MarR family transcriptional regulator
MPNQINESRALIAWSLARILGQQQRINGHPSVNELAALLAMLHSPCDLDVLLFFHRHPRAFLSTLELAQNVGYDTADIDASIEKLIMAGLVTPSKSREGTTARLYEFTPGRWASVLSSLLWVASTADGRRALRRALMMHSHDRRKRSLAQPRVI